MNILEILNQIADTSSKLEKEAILRRNKDNSTLRDTFYYAYNPFINFYIKKIPTKGQCDFDMSIEQAFDELKPLYNRKITGNDAREHLAHILDGLMSYDAEVIERIIQRDLRIGCSESTANKVWTGLIPTCEVMLAHKDISGIRYPCLGQIKSDGARCHMSLIGSRASAVSRSGKEIELHGVFDRELQILVDDNETVDGELVCYKDGKLMDRKTGNGIINKAIKGTITPEEAQMIHFEAWDIVDFTSTIPYSKRIERLTKAAEANVRIHVLETVEIKSKEEAIEFFNECIALGLEGAMMKNKNMLWVDKRSKDIGKMKADEEADLEITGWYKGDAGKKFENALGGFNCKTSDGIIRVDVGGGFDENLRFMPHTYFDSCVGKILTTGYNQKIQDKDGNWSLFLANRFKQFRLDKDVANTFDELK